MRILPVQIISLSEIALTNGLCKYYFRVCFVLDLAISLSEAISLSDAISIEIHPSFQIAISGNSDNM